jgi:seryl-tRNA synthetase
MSPIPISNEKEFPIASEREFLEALISAGHLLPSGEPGLYGRGMEFEKVQAGVDALVTRMGVADQPETLRFPPLIPKRVLEKAGYLRSFPHLSGAVFSFMGNEAAARDLAARADRNDGWGTHLSMTELVLLPAACYPAYPAMAQRGRLPRGGVTLDLGGAYVFRHEPSADPARMQMFHQRELVRIGKAEDVIAWRETWLARSSRLFQQTGLSASLEVASDAFFGRNGRFLANSQREQRLKFEAKVPIASPEPTAVASFNFHRDYFGEAFGIQLADGWVANSACVGFGLERMTLAMFRAHGLDTGNWPKGVRDRLWPNEVHCQEVT